MDLKAITLPIRKTRLRIHKKKTNLRERILKNRTRGERPEIRD